ncbi:MAG: hypothetical protein HY015_01000 [Bacteroidetes bacterium]|nr:hypothetical protein [Bacteroidota bacterium]
MKKLKSITREGIALALEKAERYRLLNEPSEAESICRDIMELEPTNQKAIVLLIWPQGNDDSILRYNTCVRIIQKHTLRERQREMVEPPLE